MSKQRRDNGEGTYTVRDADHGGGYIFRMRVNGQRVSGSGPTRKIARERAEARAASLGSKPTEQTVAELLDVWAAIRPESLKMRPTTRDQYRSLIRSRVLPHIGDVKVKALTSPQVAALFPVGSDVPASTQRSTYAALVRLLDFAVARDIVGVNVARKVKRPEASDTRKPRQVEPDAVGRFLAAADGDRLEVAAWLGFGCGLRRGEILGLRWADVDLDGGTLRVEGNLTRSSAGLVRGMPKTRKGERNVPLPPVVVDRLKTHRKRQAAEQLVAGQAWRGTGAVVTTEVGGWVEPRALSRRWRGWARKAGLPDSGTHVGRHYAASTLLASGAASVADVAAQLGHDPAVLLNTYAVAVATGQRAAADALGATLTVPISVPIASGQDGTT